MRFLSALFSKKLNLFVGCYIVVDCLSNTASMKMRAICIPFYVKPLLLNL